VSIVVQGPAAMSDSVVFNEPSSSSPKTGASSLHPVPVVAGTGKWHLLTIAAGCVLIAMFFLPLDDLRERPVSGEVPVQVVADVLGQLDMPTLSTLAEAMVMVAYIGSIAILPHLWGLLMVLYSLGWLLRLCWLQSVPHALGVVIGVAIGVTSVVGVAFYLPRLLSYLQGSSTQYCVALVLTGLTMPFAVLGVLYAMLAVRRGGWAYLYHGFAGAGVLVFVFTVMSAVFGLAGAWEHMGLTGWTVTWVVSCLLLFFRIGEARTITGLTWRRTLWYLLTLRLHKACSSGGQCPACGYYLYGLRNQRCPECGRPFTFEEVGATPESLGFAGELPARSSQGALASALPEGR